MYCPNCKQEYEGKFCPECGTKMIEKPASEGGLNLNLGDANAISGGINLADSHADNSQHFDNRGQINVHGGNYQVNNVAAQTTEADITQKNEERYRAACRRAYEDYVIDANEINELNGLAQDLGLSAERADAILNGVKQQKDAERAREEELTPRAQKRLQRLLNSMRENDLESVKDQVETFDEMVNEKNISDLHFVYYLAQAVLDYKRCIEIVEKSNADSYWKSYWSYVAYLKGGNKKEANKILDSIESKFRDYSYVNTTLLAATGELMMGNRKSANQEFMDIDEAKLSPRLQRLFDAMLLILDPKEAKEHNLREKDYLFYLRYMFNYETAEEREKKAREELKKREAEERRLKAEAEAKAAEAARIKAAEEARLKREAKRKEKAEAERLRKAEEERLRKEAEEGRKREEARRAKEEADRKAREAAAERERLAEEFRRKQQKEAEERARREAAKKVQEEAKRKAEADRIAKARQNKTYHIKITKVKSMIFAMNTLRGMFGWDVSESKSRLSKLPIEFKTSNTSEAKNMYTKLQNGGLEVTASSVNGLGEVQNNCF